VHLSQLSCGYARVRVGVGISAEVRVRVKVRVNVRSNEIIATQTAQ